MSRSVRTAACIALMLLAASCAAGSRPLATPTPEPRTTPAPDAECSAARLTNDLTDQSADIPAAVRITRQAIAEAAVSCDYEKLVELAATDGRFTYSLDEPSRTDRRGWDPTAWWRAQEDGGIEVLAVMVRLLDMRPVLGQQVQGEQRVERLYVWPRAFDPGDTVDTDWEDVRKIHSDEQAQAWRQQGVYHGWRLAIDDEGHWIFFVTGECAGATERPVDPRLCPATAERPVS
ncbi:MAG TPA: hypothetical protein VM840_00265 [Actinomycetota bacterium]|nr:hypothetical protein [Actinomycetota bacterium]